MGDWQNIAVVGEPVAYGIGFLALVLVAFSGAVADSIVTVVHEGGHMITALMVGRRVTTFRLTDAGEQVNGLTVHEGGPLGVGGIVISFAGYAAPPLAGLGGAYVVADGNSWGVLLVGIVVLLAVLLIPEINGYALLITGLLIVGFVWAVIAGGPAIQAAVAVGLVWLLLIGGLRDVITHNVNAGDADSLSRNFWIPKLVSVAGWLVIAVLSLWYGGRVLLGYT